jgi:hypothetical protein
MTLDDSLTARSRAADGGVPARAPTVATSSTGSCSDRDDLFMRLAVGLEVRDVESLREHLRLDAARVVKRWSPEASHPLERCADRPRVVYLP